MWFLKERFSSNKIPRKRTYLTLGRDKGPFEVDILDKEGHTLPVLENMRKSDLAIFKASRLVSNQW